MSQRIRGVQALTIHTDGAGHIADVSKEQPQGHWHILAKYAGLT